MSISKKKLEGAGPSPPPPRLRGWLVTSKTRNTHYGDVLTEYRCIRHPCVLKYDAFTISCPITHHRKILIPRSLVNYFRSKFS